MQYNLDELREQALIAVQNNNLPPAINNQEDFAKAGDILKLLKNKSSAIEEKRKSYTDPLYQQQKLIKADFDKVKKPIDEAIAKIEALMKVFWLEEKKRVDEEQAKLDKEAKATAGVDGALVPIVNDIKSMRGDLATSTVRSITKWRLVDLTKVPLEFLTVDEKKLNEHVKEGKACPPGIEYYQDLSLISR